VLMNSYIFGFYRPIQCPEVNKNLFEHRQNELERHTEQVSRIHGSRATMTFRREISLG
jgi:hypothetical protein